MALVKCKNSLSAALSVGGNACVCSKEGNSLADYKSFFVNSGSDSNNLTFLSIKICIINAFIFFYNDVADNDVLSSGFAAVLCCGCNCCCACSNGCYNAVFVNGCDALVAGRICNILLI